MINKIVVDSSVIVKWINQDNEKYIDKADKILQKAFEEKVFLLSPELARYEVGNVLLLGKKLTSIQAQQILATFYKLPVKFISISLNLCQKTYEIAERYKITFYDASFIALAELEEATLVTDNIKHQGKAREVKVIPLADYE